MPDPALLDRSKPTPGAFDGTWRASGPILTVRSPIHGEPIGEVVTATPEDAARVVQAAQQAFATWRLVPAPQRAEVVRQLGEALRSHKEALAQLVTLEMGKPIVEARGEVQEMIDICDFAVGLGRQIGGSTLPSERPGHRLQESWHPLGVVGVITAFNFPVAVWAWNAALALTCGDTVVWKPSSKAPLAAAACTRIAAEVLERNGHPAAVCSLVVGSGRAIGDRLIADPRLALVSYTGSVPIGRHVGQVVQARFGRSLLELGGNNAAIVTPSADPAQALAAVFFGAIGTAGQRCTSTRRVFVHESRYDEFVEALKSGLARLPIGDPRDERQLMGPLVDTAAVAAMQAAIARAREQGGEVLSGGEVLGHGSGCWVTPCLIAAHPGMQEPGGIVAEETFAPILYLFRYRDLDQAITLQNAVPQGLSSAIFTTDLREMERFLGPAGSDCGMANVNTSTSGAEIGGAFGGEKETGGGRESGSDAWKTYMRRQTAVINSSGSIALAQGVKFDL